MILFKERNHLMHIKTGNFICICQGRLDIKSAEISIRQIQYLGPFGKVWLEEKRDPIFPPFSCNKKFFAPPPLFCTWMMIYRMCNGIVMSVLLFIFISANHPHSEEFENKLKRNFFFRRLSINFDNRKMTDWMSRVRTHSAGKLKGLKNDDGYKCADCLYAIFLLKIDVEKRNKFNAHCHSRSVGQLTRHSPEICNISCDKRTKIGFACLTGMW